MTQGKIGHFVLTAQDIANGMITNFEESVGKKEYIPSQELARELSENYPKMLESRIEWGKANFPGDFYIEVASKTEPIPPYRTLRRIHVARLSCPTPRPSQHVWKYIRAKDIVEKLWMLPSAKECIAIYRNRFYLQFRTLETPRMVMDLFDGTLLKRAKLENGESLTDNTSHRIIFDEREFERIRNEANATGRIIT